MASPSPASLLLPLFSSILEFAVPGFTQDLAPDARSLPVGALKGVALVAKTWLSSVQQLVSQYHQETMEIQLDSGSHFTFLDICREASRRGGAVRDLRLTVGSRNDKYPEVMATSTKTEALDVDWHSMFEHLPGLKRLDLTLVPLESKHLPEILRAAGKFCLQMEMLILPRKADLERVISGPSIDSVMSALYAAMEKWYSKGSHAGLRQLTIPSRNDVLRRTQRSTEFVENIIRFCPDIEYWNGAENVYQHDEEETVRCQDKWMIPLQTWEKFSQTCRNLRSFDWVVPFADPFFHVFGCYPKPCLTELNLTPNLLWDWDEFFRGCDGMTSEAIKDCYGPHVKNIGALFKGCPGLSTVTVEIDLQEYVEADIPRFNIDAFGDALWTAAAEHCPLLETVDIIVDSDFVLLAMACISTFSDLSLIKLAELE